MTADSGLLLRGSGSAHNSLYAPFVVRSLALFAEANIDLQPYPLLDGSLLHRSGWAGGGSRRQLVELSVHAYRTDERIRQARLVLIEGSPALQVLNFCIFPALQYGLPTFAADLVSLPGGHLIALDCAPNRAVAADPTYAPGGALASAYARHRQWLPDGGPVPDAAARFFSPCFLWSRLPAGAESDAIVASRVFEAFDDYLRTYLHLVGAATPLESARARGDAGDAQIAYARYRADSDPARPMLARLFGSQYAERLIREVLFDLPLRMEATNE